MYVDFCMFLCTFECSCYDTAGGLSKSREDIMDLGYLGTYPITRKGG